MCQQCLESYQAASFVVGQDAAMFLLWNETAFPFSDGDETTRQMAEAVDKLAEVPSQQRSATET